MIDTVVLTLGQDKFSIFKHNRFNPSTEGLYKHRYRLGSRGNLCCIQRPTASELRKGNYKPRLSVTQRINRYSYPEITLKIEFSAPKLLFGNNFDELQDSDFNLVILRLQQELEEMGVAVSPAILANALVSAIHYSKNIPLVDYTLPYTYIEQLSKINLNKRLDLNQTDFRNGGHSLKYRANSFEVAFYDKIKDLRKAKISEKRAEETQNAIQISLLDNITLVKPFEVLRMEVRLNRRQKLNQVLSNIGIQIDPIFCNLFQKEIASKILLYYLDYFTSDYLCILQRDHSKPERLFADLLNKNPGIGLNRALKMLGIHMLLDSLGTRRFRELTSSYGDASWYRLNKEIKTLNYTRHEDRFWSLRECLEGFNTLKLVDFLC